MLDLSWVVSQESMEGSLAQLLAVVIYRIEREDGQAMTVVVTCSADGPMVAV